MIFFFFSLLIKTNFYLLPDPNVSQEAKEHAKEVLKEHEAM